MSKRKPYPRATRWGLWRRHGLKTSQKSLSYCRNLGSFSFIASLPVFFIISERACGSWYQCLNHFPFVSLAASKILGVSSLPARPPSHCCPSWMQRGWGWQRRSGRTRKEEMERRGKKGGVGERKLNPSVYVQGLSQSRTPQIAFSFTLIPGKGPIKMAPIGNGRVIATGSL